MLGGWGCIVVAMAICFFRFSSSYSNCEGGRRMKEKSLRGCTCKISRIPRRHQFQDLNG